MVPRRRGSHRPPATIAWLRSLWPWAKTPPPAVPAATLLAPTLSGDELLAATDRRKNRRNAAIGAAAALLVLSGGGLIARAGGDAQDAEAERDSAAGQVVSLSDQILAECRTGELTGPICPNAARAKADPVPDARTPEPPSTDAIAAAVAGYLESNPPPAGPGPTREQITAAVVAELAANPPEPGRPPTDGEIAAAVARFLESNPPPAGDPGRPPTTGEIAAAVAAYLQENPPPRGPKGDAGTNGTDGADGAQGVGVTDVSGPGRNPSGSCVVTFTLTDPATGATRTDSIPVPDSFCGSPPTTETPSG